MSEVEGLRELSKKLSALGKTTGSKVLRQAANLSVKSVVDDAKANVPIGKKEHKTYKGRVVAPGFASRNVVKKSRLSKDKRTVRVSIGVRREAFYVVSFLELGTKYIPKRPWLTRALERNQKQVVSAFKERLKKKIENVAKK